MAKNPTITKFISIIVEMLPLIFREVLLVSIADRHLMLDISSSDLTEYFCYYVHPQCQKAFKFGLRGKLTERRKSATAFV